MKKFFLASLLLAASIINTKTVDNHLESFNELKKEDQKKLLKGARIALKCHLLNDATCQEFQKFSNEILIKKTQAATFQTNDLKGAEICEKLKNNINTTCQHIPIEAIHKKYNHNLLFSHKDPGYNAIVDNDISDDELKVIFNSSLTEAEKGAYFHALILQKIEGEKFTVREFAYSCISALMQWFTK